MRELGIIEDGAVLIADGKIVAVGTTDEVAKHELLTAKPAHVDEIDCSGKVVLPGFVDSHTHPVFTAPRLIDFEKRIAGATYEEIAEAGGGIRASLRGVRDASPTGACRPRGSWARRDGEARHHHGRMQVRLRPQLRRRDEIAGGDSRSVASVGRLRWCRPCWRRTWSRRSIAKIRQEYVRIICEDMIPTAAKLKLAAYVDVFCERGAFSMEQSRRILRSAVEHNLGVRAHVCQLTPAQLAPLMEFHPASLDHLDFVSDEDVAVLSKLDTVATLLPAANYFLGLESFPPARKLLDAGVAVALATDYNPGTSPTASMPFVLSVACTHMKMSPAEALVAATYNGACALQLQGRKGSLESGKDADVAIFDVQDYRELAYWFGVNRCRETILNGVRQAADDRVSTSSSRATEHSSPRSSVR